MPIKLKRIYEQPEKSDGIRILVERLWPRGMSKEAAKVDIWLKEAAPSTELRKWFNHDTDRWDDFKQRYFAELVENEDTLSPILKDLQQKNVTFVFASKEEWYNNSAALKEYIESRLLK